MNRLAAQAGARTLARRVRRRPRHAGWSLPFEGIVEMMALGTPSRDISHAEQVRGPLDHVTLLARSLPVQRTAVHLNGFDAEWFTVPHSREDRVLLYLHGGGYISGSPSSHAALIAHVAEAGQARAFAPDYRLAPEHCFPAALEDVWTAYWWLLAQGIAPGQIMVAGDSAGGGLTLSLLLALREAGMPLPAAGVCLSPWFDLALTAPSLETNQASDYLNLAVLSASASMYLGEHDPRDPLVSPLYADLRGLPPLLIQAGTAEMLLDDSRRFARRAAEAGNVVDLELWPAMVHVWHFTYAIERQAREAIGSIARFSHRYLPA